MVHSDRGSAGVIHAYRGGLFISWWFTLYSYRGGLLLSWWFTPIVVVYSYRAYVSGSLLLR